MDNELKFWAVSLMGPIASGKGTQAEFLAMEFGLVHLENSRIIEEKFVQDPDNPVVQEAKKAYLAGQWIDPQVMMNWIIGTMKDVAARHQGIVMSSGFRTEYETEKELEFFEQAYGRENIKIITLTLSEKTSIERSLNRRICKANRHPIPNLPEYRDLKVCPQDGSELERRVLDSPEIVPKRYQEYIVKTLPVIDFIKKRGYNIIEINGEQSMEDVHRDILNKLW